VNYIGFQDPKDFLIAYEDMLDFLQDQSNWISMEQELSLKGVKAMTFYDVVLDYILMDAFEDIESPPSSVMAVVQNRWLSNGFKETVCILSLRIHLQQVQALFVLCAKGLEKESG
jgi:hypothetical protein